MNIKDWRARWLDSINELTSLELQQTSWLDQTVTNPHWSFIEFMCCYFDDLGIEDHYKYELEHGWVSVEEFEAIKDWHFLLDKYDSPNDDDHNRAAILKDKKWLDILKKGVLAKEKLVVLLGKRESDILMESIDYTLYKYWTY